MDSRHLCLGFVVVALGCGGAKTESKPATSTTTEPAQTGTKTPTTYRFRMRWNFGPCPDGSKRSCHQEVYFLADGTVQSFVWPEPSNTGTEGPPRFAEKKAAADVLKRVDAVMENVSFKKGMKDGFGCQPDYDATIRIEIPKDEKVVSQEVTHCQGNTARELIDVVESYRWMAGDPDPTVTRSAK